MKFFLYYYYHWTAYQVENGSVPIWLLLFFKIFLVGTKEQASDKDDNCETRCNDEVLIHHLASCEILSPESIINLAVKEIELLCR